MSGRLDQIHADVIAALEARGARRNGDELRFRCLLPDHEDTTPSADYNLAKRAYKCQGCGASGGLIVGDQPIAALLGLAVEAARNGNGNRRKRRGTIVATYDYTDAAGNLLFQVVRCEPKSFRQRRPDGDGWAWNLQGVERVLYRLPEVKAATHVYIVEGEKDADALRNLGLTATTCPGGAGKWRAEYAERFRSDQLVTILPDADDAGRKHAEEIAASLYGRVASVQILELPDVPDKGDVSDFIAGFDDPEEVAERLAIMSEAAPEWAPGQEDEAEEETRTLSLEDFHAYMPMHRYIFAPSGEMWPAASINSRIDPVQTEGGDTISASRWIDQNRPVEQMTWAPGAPQLVKDRLMADGGWIDHAGTRVFNLYRPPRIEPGDASDAGPWIEHAERLFDDPDVTEHVVSWLAHRVQRPGQKVNHALVLGGLQGIGKDTLLEPVKHAVGPWNFGEIGPTQLLGRFNGWVKSVVLRVSEARDLGDIDRYGFYERMKMYTAAPPDVIRVDEKFINEYSALNVVGVVITTNHKTAGIYLPADDRRHFVAWSPLSKDDFDSSYWDRLWSWYQAGGHQHVAAFLAEHDLSNFDAKAPPPKTPAFWDMVEASRAPEDAELADALDRLGNPRAVTVSQIAGQADREFADWLQDRRNARQVPHRFEEVGYVSVRNPAATSDGRWKVGGRRQVIYAHHELTRRDQIAAAQALVEETR